MKKRPRPWIRFPQMLTKLLFSPSNEHPDRKPKADRGLVKSINIFKFVFPDVCSYVMSRMETISIIIILVKLNNSLSFLYAWFCTVLHRQFCTATFIQRVLFRDFCTGNFVLGILYWEFSTGSFIQGILCKEFDAEREFVLGVLYRDFYAKSLMQRGSFVLGVLYREIYTACFIQGFLYKQF